MKYYRYLLVVFVVMMFGVVGMAFAQSAPATPNIPARPTATLEPTAEATEEVSAQEATAEATEEPTPQDPPGLLESNDVRISSVLINLRFSWQDKFFVMENRNSERVLPPYRRLQFRDDTGQKFSIRELEFESGNCIVLYDATQYDLTAEKPGPTLDEVRAVANCYSNNVPYVPVYEAPFWSLGDTQRFIMIHFDPRYEFVTWSCTTGGIQSCLVNRNGIVASNNDFVIPTPTTPPPVEVVTFWNNEVFVILNTNDVGVDLTDFTLEGFEPKEAQWIMELDRAGVPYKLNDVRPGSCLTVYVGIEQPSLNIGNFRCSRVIGFRSLTSFDQQMWTESKFLVRPSNTSCAGVEANVASCRVRVPSVGR